VFETLSLKLKADENNIVRMEANRIPKKKIDEAKGSWTAERIMEKANYTWTG
jgi:hypothetical protein